MLEVGDEAGDDVPADRLREHVDEPDEERADVVARRPGLARGGTASEPARYASRTSAAREGHQR